MKLKTIYTLLISILAWTLFNSNSSGAGASNFNCNNCHSGSSSTTTIDSVILRDVTTLDKLVKYSPTKPYIITIYGSNSGGLNRFGFQMTHNGKGSFSNPSSDCQTVGNIWEHKQKISGSASKFQVSARWNAPAKGTGSVTLDAYLNAVDNDNGTSGDKPSNKFTLNLEELTSADSAAVEVRILSGNNPSKNLEAITFKAYAYNGGSTPEFQWKVNGNNIGPRGFEDTYTSSILKNNDTVSCWMYSSQSGAFPNPAISNKIVRTIFNSNPTTGRITNNGDNTKPQIVPISDKTFKILQIGKTAKVEIWNLQGSLVLKTNLSHDETLDLSAVSSGVYLVKIVINSHIYTNKLEFK